MQSVMPLSEDQDPFSKALCIMAFELHAGSRRALEAEGATPISRLEPANRIGEEDEDWAEGWGVWGLQRSHWIHKGAL